MRIECHVHEEVASVFLGELSHVYTTTDLLNLVPKFVPPTV